MENLRVSKVSVIVPFLNEEKHIERCILSLLGQKCVGVGCEIVMIDNGSSDGSVGVVKKYPQVKLLYEKKPNVYAARNLGVKASSGDVLAFTDADCEVGKGWVSRMLEILSNGEVGLVMGDRYFPSSKRKSGLRYFEDYENVRTKYLFDNYDSLYFHGYTNNMAVQRSLFDGVGGFRELPVCGDSDLVHRVLEKYPRKKVVYDHKVWVNHLEVGGMGVWMRKMFVYGKENRKLERGTGSKILPFWGRLKAMWLTLREKKYCWKDVVGALVLIQLGGLVYKMGDFVGRFGDSYD